MRLRPALAGFALGALTAVGIARADPVLVDAHAGTLELVTSDPVEQAKLDRIDGLAFDSFGNLFGALEINSAAGGAVYIDKATGAVTPLVTGIQRADQIALHPGGDFFLTSEVAPASTTLRLFRMVVSYAPGAVPASATASGVTTSVALNNPEGLLVLDATDAFGDLGDVYVAEHATPGRIANVDPATGVATVLASGLTAAEGMDIGSFGGVNPRAIYVAETSANRITRIESTGTALPFGDPSSIALTLPDNVEFGPDSLLYVSEDVTPGGRIIRIAPDGTYSAFATGFSAPQGLAFDPATGHLYISEQGLDRIWRVRFGAAAVPAVGAWGLGVLACALGLASVWLVGRES